MHKARLVIFFFLLLPLTQPATVVLRIKFGYLLEPLVSISRDCVNGSIKIELPRPGRSFLGKISFWGLPQKIGPGALVGRGEFICSQTKLRS